MHLHKHYSRLIGWTACHSSCTLCHVSAAPVKSLSMLRWGLAIYWQESLIHGACCPLVSRTDGRLARGEGRSEKPNPKTQSYIYLSSHHDSTWPYFIFSSKIRSQGVPAELQKSLHIVQADTHTQSYIQTHMQTDKCTHCIAHALVMCYTKATRHPTTILSMHPNLTLVYWNYSIFFYINWTWPQTERDWIMSGKSCDILITSKLSLSPPPLGVLANVNGSWITMSSLVWS